MSNNRAILVVGQSGQLARCLALHAQRTGVRLVSFGRPELDLEDQSSIERVVARVEPSAIVNAGAYTAVDKAEAEPDRAFAINRDGAAGLARIAAEAHIPLVHISTDYVFSGEKSTPYTEDDATAPLSVYGHSKLAGEQAVRQAYPEAVVIRTGWNYSPFGHNFLRTMLRLASTQSVVRVVGDQRGAPTSSADLASGVLDIVQQLGRPRRPEPGIYHLTAAGETSWHGFTAAIFAGLARRGQKVPKLQQITTPEYPTPARRPANSRLDSSKAERTFGVQLPPWQLSLEKCMDQLLMESIS